MIGDVLVAMAGRALAEPHDLVAALQPDHVGAAVMVSLLRGGEPRELEVTVGERPPRA
jgi:S1-C subfamily serine protease